jgi:hypothetical protein
MEKNMKKSFWLGTTTLIALAVAGPINQARAAACATSDISFTIASAPPVTYTPVKCATAVNNGSPDTETANMNTALGTQFTTFAATDGTSDTVSGIKFTLSADGQNPGAWHMTWTDTNGAAPRNLPVTVNLDFYLNGGNNGNAYELTNVLLPISPNGGNGTYDITFLNNGGQVPAFSHATVSGAFVDPTPPPPVPEPASLALLGVGMLGIGLVRRRRNEA